MNSIHHHRRLRHTAPHGMATLEFAMALPFLLLFMVGITWLAKSVIGQADVLVQARNSAWKRRFEDTAKKPLMFPFGVGDAKNPLYSTAKDYVTESATTKIDISRIFDDAARPKASVTVLAGSWDHRALDLNKPPNFKLYLIASGNAVTGNIQTQLGQLGALINNVEQMGTAAIAQAVTKGNDAENAANNSESTGNAGNSQNEAEKEQKKKELLEEQGKLGGGVFNDPFGNGGVIPVSGGQLDETNDEIARLQSDIELKKKLPANPDEEQEKERQAAIARDERKLQLLKDRKQRIEAEIKDNDEELKGFD